MQAVKKHKDKRVKKLELGIARKDSKILNLAEVLSAATISKFGTMTTDSDAGNSRMHNKLSKGSEGQLKVMKINSDNKSK